MFHPSLIKVDGILVLLSLFMSELVIIFQERPSQREREVLETFIFGGKQVVGRALNGGVSAGMCHWMAAGYVTFLSLAAK